MKLDLNELVDAVFRGVVFVAFSFIASLAILTTRPGRGCVWLLHRLRLRASDQIKPRVFLFLAIALALASPMFVAFASGPSADPFEYKIYNDSAPEMGTLGRAYREAVSKTKSEAFFTIAIAAIVGVAIVHLTAMGLGPAIFAMRQRRALLLSELMLVAGCQFVAIGALYVFDQLTNPIQVWPDLDINLVERVPSAIVEIFSSSPPTSRCVNIVFLCATTAILSLPFPISYLMGKRAWWLAHPQRSAIRPVWIARSATAAIIGLIANLTLGVSFVAAAYVNDSIGPREKLPYSLDRVSCGVDFARRPRMVQVTLVATNTGDLPWLFDNQEFGIHISAARTETDPPRQGRPSDRIGSRGQFTSIRVSSGSGSSPTLLEAGKSIVLHIEAEVDDQVAIFLSSHPDDQRCTIAANQDYPIGAIGPLTQSVP